MKFNIDAAFPDTPEVFTRSIRASARRAARAGRIKTRLASVCCAAAALMLVAFGALYWARLSADPVKAGVASPERLGDMSVVYSSSEDPCWHVTATCAGGVELALKTARAFGKTPCPSCAGGELTSPQ